jgi:hypothetical protein
LLLILKIKDEKIIFNCSSYFSYFFIFLAQESTTTPTIAPPAATPIPPKEKKVDLNCMKSAIEKKKKIGCFKNSKRNAI